MQRKDNKTSVGGALMGLLGVAIGAGLGYIANKILQPQVQPKKQEPKPEPVIPAKSPASQIPKTEIGSYDELEELMICPITHCNLCGYFRNHD